MFEYETLIRLFLASLTCYRLSRMIALDDGPFFIFKRIRYWIKDKAYIGANNVNEIYFSPNNIDGEIGDRHFGRWHNLAEGVTCPYCVGVWLSLPLFLFVIYPMTVTDLFFVLISISGGQAFLQSFDKKNVSND